MSKEKSIPKFSKFEDDTELQAGIDDGGERITYGEGMAMREPSDGKGRFDLITPFGLWRLARWYELGGHKYAPRNWEKGIPFSRYLDSAMRHLNKFLMGMNDEDHLSAAAWNIFAIIHHQELGQWELDDLPHYKGLGYGAGAPLPEGFEEHWKKHLEELEAKCDKVSKEAKAAMEAQIDDLKAILKALEVEKKEKDRVDAMLNNAKLEPHYPSYPKDPIYGLPCQGDTV